MVSRPGGSLRVLSAAETRAPHFTARLADAVVVTGSGALLLQERPWARPGVPGGLNLFGGHVEAGESPLQGLIRELREELGAVPAPAEVIPLGAVTEAWTGHAEVVHLWFWHDAGGRITGCYEGRARAFPCAADALERADLMDYARWAIGACLARGLLPR